MFENRIDGAVKLARELKKEKWENPIVVALPRGGVPMGDVIAQALDVELEIVVPRKIGARGHEEYAIGALVEDGEVIWNEKERAAADENWVKEAVEKERQEAKRRREVYGLGKPKKSFTDRDVILVDDGIATGHTMRAAISSIKSEKPKSITVAVPVAPPDIVKDISKIVDKIICLEQPMLFMAVGAHYQDFPQTTDEEVVEIMKKYV